MLGVADDAGGAVEIDIVIALALAEGLHRRYATRRSAIEVTYAVAPGAHDVTAVERIAQRVGTWFQVEPRQMQSRRRLRHTLLPRQIGMYLARQLTALSLGQIGTYFGGRDHTTVLHACRKVEEAMKKDAVLSGAVRQIHAELA